MHTEGRRKPYKKKADIYYKKAVWLGFDLPCLFKFLPLILFSTESSSTAASSAPPSIHNDSHWSIQAFNNTQRSHDNMSPDRMYTHRMSRLKYTGLGLPLRLGIWICIRVKVIVAELWMGVSGDILTGTFWPRTFWPSTHSRARPSYVSGMHKQWVHFVPLNTD